MVSIVSPGFIALNFCFHTVEVFSVVFFHFASFAFNLVFN